MGESTDSVNRVALSRKMAALPQQEALQLQPALTQSLDRTHGPAAEARRPKSVIFSYGQVFQSTAIQLKQNPAVTWHVADTDPAECKNHRSHQKQAGSSYRNRTQHCQSQPVLLLLSSWLRTKTEREEGILLPSKAQMSV